MFNKEVYCSHVYLWVRILEEIAACIDLNSAQILRYTILTKNVFSTTKLCN